MKLAEYITRNLDAPFVWGAHDCILYAAGWVFAATGRDHLQGIPKWNSALQAARVLKAYGGLESIMDERFPGCNPRQAKDGDLALYRGSVCIFSGIHIVGPGPAGLTFVRRSAAEAAWRLA